MEPNGKRAKSMKEVCVDQFGETYYLAEAALLNTGNTLTLHGPPSSVCLMTITQ